MCLFFFFFNDTATTEIYTLSLHDALPISSEAPDFTAAPRNWLKVASSMASASRARAACPRGGGDRKSTRLNSSHSQISYAVFCLKKKKNKKRAYIHNTSDVRKCRYRVSK